MGWRVIVGCPVWASQYQPCMLMWLRLETLLLMILSATWYTRRRFKGKSTSTMWYNSSTPSQVWHCLIAVYDPTSPSLDSVPAISPLIDMPCYFHAMLLYCFVCMIVGLFISCGYLASTFKVLTSWLIMPDSRRGSSSTIARRWSEKC